VNVPAQVCKFFVDSLQRHREGCMCWFGGLRLLVSSMEISKAQQTGRSCGFYQMLLATKTRERLCREGDAD
jgi:hypothetical protein